MCPDPLFREDLPKSDYNFMVRVNRLADEPNEEQADIQTENSTWNGSAEAGTIEVDLFGLQSQINQSSANKEVSIIRVTKLIKADLLNTKGDVRVSLRLN
jgi:hypothetical protein